MPRRTPFSLDPISSAPLRPGSFFPGRVEGVGGGSWLQKNGKLGKKDVGFLWGYHIASQMMFIRLEKPGGTWWYHLFLNEFFTFCFLFKYKAQMLQSLRKALFIQPFTSGVNKIHSFPKRSGKNRQNCHVIWSFLQGSYHLKNILIFSSTTSMHHIRMNRTRPRSKSLQFLGLEK